MAKEKKAAKKAAAKKGKTTKKRAESNEPPTAKETAEAIKRLKEVASGKKNGAIIVLEEFTNKKGEAGIEGMSYWRGMDPKKRVATLLSVSGMPTPIFMLMATLMGGEGDHEHDAEGNCL